MPTLFLASKSRSRRELLDLCRIPYQLVEQDADESKHPDLPLIELVQYLAEFKMAHVQLPALELTERNQHNSTSNICVLTADTLGSTNGELCRKPVDRADAIRMLHAYRDGATTATGYCVDRRRWNSSTQSWELDQRITGVATATYKFNVPDSMLDQYLDHAFSGVSYLDVSGAVQIEGYGLQYLGDIQGSYTAIVGLPMYEVRESLAQLGFFDATA